MENYTQYLQRMTESTQYTTKSLIPIFASLHTANIEKPRILEVGIGSSVVGELIRKAIPSAYLVGIDINEENIEKAKLLNIYNELSVNSFMKYETKQFDLIIFSSVIHEIGSYDKDLNYSNLISADEIIDSIIRKAWWLTKTHGHIIIRDGLAEQSELRNSNDTYFTKTQETVTKLYNFVEQFKVYNNSEFKLDTLIVKTNVKDKASVYYEIECPRWLMREFLCTATWGSESWEREIKERFCFIDDETLRNIFEKNIFKIKTAIYSSEQYNEYFKDLILQPNEQNIIGLYVIEKENW